MHEYLAIVYIGLGVAALKVLAILWFGRKQAKIISVARLPNGTWAGIDTFRLAVYVDVGEDKFHEWRAEHISGGDLSWVDMNGNKPSCKLKKQLNRVALFNFGKFPSARLKNPPPPESKTGTEG